MQKRTAAIVGVIGLLAMLLHDVWREYQVRRSFAVVIYWVFFYVIFRGYLFYC